jgi:hypothetical protein
VTTPRDEDICRFDVAMHDACTVRRLQRVGHLDGDGKKLLRWEGPNRDQVAQRFAVEELDDHKSAAILFADIVNRTDVGMIQGRRGPSFAAKALQRRGIMSNAIGKKLEGYKPAKADILGFVDHAHASAPEFLDDAVVRDGLANQ